MKVPVKIVLDSPFAKVPQYAKSGDAGADVCVVPAADADSELFGKTFHSADGGHDTFDVGDHYIPANQTVLLPLGFRVEIPDGYEIQVRSRSGLSKRGLIVANSPGTIDSGYRGPCMVLLANRNAYPVVVKAGSRVAQFVLKEAPQAEFELVSELSDSDRGVGGFGSTGV